MDLPGRFGTIALLRANTPSNADATSVVTSFGVDTPAVSFGREPACSVRLYYADVAPVHARIVFSEHSTNKNKAFLEVLGPSGVLVDGCRVYPSGESGNKIKTIPLENGSEVVIHGKRFRFTYPPKDMRAALLAATPTRPANRALRLSMIASAQVFSPRPSPDPRENLRVLQSPLRAPFARARSRSRSPSPTKNRNNARGAPASTVPEDVDAEDDEEEEEQEITLVQGAHPRVVEEAKDLVILEDVEVVPPSLPAPSSSSSTGAGLHAQAPPPKTPARRQSLHRAVLIRSAHRAVLAATATGLGASASAAAATPAESAPKTKTTTPVLRGWTAPSPTSSTSTSPSPVTPRLRITISPSKDAAPVASAHDDQMDVKMQDAEEDEENEDEEEAEVRALRLEVVSVSSDSESDDEDRQDQGGEREEDVQPKTVGWRKSLERLWPFGRVKTEEEEVAMPDAEPENDDAQDEHANDHDDHDSDNENEIEEILIHTGVGITTPTPTATPTQGMMSPKRKTVAQAVTTPKEQPIPPRPTTSFGMRRSPEKDRARTSVSPEKEKSRPFVVRTSMSPDKEKTRLFGAAAPRAPSTSPEREKTPGGTGRGAPTSPVKTKAAGAEEGPFAGWAPHPAARTPPGFGKPSAAPAAAETTVQEKEAERMDVDCEEGQEEYESLYAGVAKEAREVDATPAPAPAPATKLGPFMTPQAPPVPPSGFITPLATGSGAGAGGVPRYSIGGVARRVRVEESPWKAVPLPPSPIKSSASSTPDVKATPAVSEAEKAAIRERRRSALTQPDQWWGGGVPGLSPRKAAASPRKPMKSGIALGRVGEERAANDGEGEEGGENEKMGGEEPDARKLLRGLMETVDVLKRRRDSVFAEAEGRRVSVERDEQGETETAMDVDLYPPAPAPSTPKPAARRGSTATPPPAIALPDDDEAVEAEPEPVPAKPVHHARKAATELEPQPSSEAPTKARRGRKATDDAAEQETAGALLLAPAAPAKGPARRGRSRSTTPQPPAEEEQGQESAPAPPTTKTRRGRSRAPTAEPEQESDTEQAVAPVKRAARKPPSTSKAVVAAAPATEPVKRGRKAAAATGAVPVPTSAPERKTTRARGKSRAPEVGAGEDEDAEADPLDSIEAEVQEVEVVAVVAPPKRRATASKAKAVPVKEEEAEPVLEVPAQPRTARAKKPVTTVKGTAAAPAAPKARATRKGLTPASAPAGVEKENENEGGQEEPTTTKVVRVSRSRKVKDEPVEVVAVAATVPKRATRARTRT